VAGGQSRIRRHLRRGLSHNVFQESACIVIPKQFFHLHAELLIVAAKPIEQRKAGRRRAAVNLLINQLDLLPAFRRHRGKRVASY
jgi:hypothetical protein